MMNNAVGLTIQAAPSMDTGVITSDAAVSLVQGCETDDCLNQNTGDFLATLNAELDILTEVESIDFSALEPSVTEEETLESIVFDDKNSEKIIDLDESWLALSQAQWVSINNEAKELAQLIEPDKQQSFEEFTQNLDVLLQQAIQELPETVTALPLTPENKAFIRQQAIALLEQQNPGFVAKIRQAEGQRLPVEGNIMPNTALDEGISNAVKNLQAESSNPSVWMNNTRHNDLDTGSQVMVDKAQKDSEVHTGSEHESDSEMDLSMKRFFEATNNKGEPSHERELLNDMPQKTDIKNISGQKLAAEIFATPLNATLGVNQSPVNHLTSTAVMPATTLHLPQNSSPEQWGSALGTKIQWMINSKMDSAEIRIDPPHLGKMDISIKMTDDGANIVIQTQLAATRDLVDAASQRLKDMLEQAGHERVDVDVSQQENRQTEQQFSDSDEYNESHTPSVMDSNEHSETMSAEIRPETLHHNRVGLDLFA